LDGGNGSHAAVVDLVLRGHEVRWWRRSAPFPPDGRLRYRTPEATGEVTPALVTHDLVAAVAGSDLIIAPVPASAQQDLLAALAPVLEWGRRWRLLRGPSEAGSARGSGSMSPS
jgi:opine dehydrogenase